LILPFSVSSVRAWPESALGTMATVPEAMVMTDLNSSFSTKIDKDLTKFEAIGIGPGIGTASETKMLLREIFDAYKNPLVLDADALNIIASQKDLLKLIPANSIITPHPKEFERLFGESTNDFDRIQLALQKAKELMKQKGAEIIEIEYLDKINAKNDAEFDLMKYEFKYGINKYLSTANSPVKTLKDLIEFNKKNEDKTMPGFKQETFEMCDKKGDLNSKEYLQALDKSHNGSKKIIDAAMQENKLDALAGLTMGPACSIDIIYGDRWGDVFLTGPAAMSGYPHISVPCGMVYALPVGLSFFSGAYKEGEIISIAYAYEQASKNRMIPGFRKSFLI
jgi:Asp-tRNA(Asn)/Glu-tRNA(Gln) amidotransferase A subunit family amidase